MENEELFGHIDNPRNGQQPTDQQEDGSVEEEARQERTETDDKCLVDESKVNLEKLEEILEALPDEKQGELLLALQISGSSSWSGLLPRPETFKEYPERVQEKMIAWNDAQILDESKRSDKLTNAFVSQKKWGQILTFTLNLVFVAFAFIAFMITLNPAAFGFLAVPGITIAVNVIRERRGDD